MEARGLAHGGPLQAVGARFSYLWCLGAVLLLIWSGPAPAAEPSAYTPKGADTCLKCHDEDSTFPVVSIFKTAHGRVADPRTPFAGLQCEACHGAGGEHARKKAADEPQGPIGTFGMNAKTPVAEQNQACTGCHAGGDRQHWPGSAHERADVPCASCHAVHAQHDPVLAKLDEPQVCASCHGSVRAESLRPSAHPLHDGGMACSDCHAPHGSLADPLLVGSSTNDTCHNCHADKRGPFLWEHAPVAEDCTLCHTAHGSTQRALLVQRSPLLCQQCHAQDGHPSLAHTPAGLPSGSPSGFLLVNGCANCHTQVHGSNHPSGASLTR